MPSASPRQGSWLTIRDPRPQIVGALHRVPVQQAEPSCTGLISVSSTTLFQLYKALFSVGLPTAFSKKYGYGLFYPIYLMVAAKPE